MNSEIWDGLEDNYPKPGTTADRDAEAASEVEFREFGWNLPKPKVKSSEDSDYVISGQDQLEAYVSDPTRDERPPELPS